jgi:hypothetical protein
MSDVDTLGSNNDGTGITGSVESECEVSSTKSVLDRTAQWRGSFRIQYIDEIWHVSGYPVNEVFFYDAHIATRNDGSIVGFGLVTIANEVAIIENPK